MKNFIAALCAFAAATVAIAQTPQTINYQAVARNSAGNPLLNSSVAVRISIRDGSATGTVVYAERDTATTNAFGLFTVSIGSGNVISGTFAGINWGSGDKYMQVELDPTGGSSYTDMGTSQLLSVPYALHAQSSADNHWAQSGNDVYNTNSGNVGIGTTTPTAKLQVAGNAKIADANTNSGNSQLRIEANSNFGSASYAGLEFVSNAASAGADISGRIYSYYASPSYTSATTTFQTVAAGPAWVDAMSLTDGKVGIGTTTPNYRLTVKGSGNEVYSVWSEDGTQAADNFTFQIAPGSGTSTTRIGYLMGNFGSSFGFMLANTRNAPIRFGIGAGPAEVMRITPSGQLGIGTTNPSAKLEVAGNVKIADGTEGAGKVLVSDANGLASWQNLAVGTTSYTGLSHNRFYISTSTGSPYTNITTAGSSVVIIPGGAPSNGFIDGFQHNGPDEIVIYNNNATNWTIRPNQSTPSVPFYTGPGGANYVLAPGESVRVFYEPTTAKWWVLNGQ